MQAGNYLNQFAECNRSMVANMFYECRRQWIGGTPSPADLVSAVCGRALTLFREGDSRGELLEQIYHSLREPEAAEFAKYVIWREALPAEERAKLKRESGEAFKQKFMAKQQPTAKQLSFLKSLGATEMPTDRATASRMIDELLKRKKAA